MNANELSATKKLIELYIDRVTIFQNHVSVTLKFHLNLTLDNSDNGSGRGQTPLTSTKHCPKSLDYQGFSAFLM